jgi:heme/copper-type cytochrome/quinol oxidase subunit 2
MARLITLWTLIRHWADTRHETLTRAGAERGSVTMEHVLWAVAIIAIVGIVVAAITTFVQTQAGNIT